MRVELYCKFCIQAVAKTALAIATAFTCLTGWSQSVVFPDSVPKAQVHIRFEKGPYDSVRLVWGDHTWAALPESYWPAGTYMVKGHLETPLTESRKSFFLDLALPVGDSLKLGLAGKLGNGKWWEPMDIYVTGALPDTLRVRRTVSIETFERQTTELFTYYNWEWIPSLVLIFLAAGWFFWAWYTAAGGAARELSFDGFMPDFRLILGVSAGLTVFFLATTALFTSYFRSLNEVWDSGGWIKHVLIQGSLTRENVLAVWWSSVLLSCVGFLALLVGFTGSKTPVWVRLPWWLVGLGFIALSADEQGSMHERVFMLNYLLETEDEPEGGKWKLAIVGAVGLAAVVPGWWYKLRQNRASLIWFGVGLLCLLSVPVQEEIEMSLFRMAVEGQPWRRPIWHMLLEEGTEMAGFLCFLAAFIPLAGPVTFRGNRLSLSVARAAVAVLFAILALGVPVSRILLEQVFAIGDTGRLSFWFPLIGALLAALLAAWAYSGSVKAGRNGGYLKGLSLWMLVWSAFHGANIRIWGETVQAGSVTGAFVVEGLLVMAGLAVIWATYRSHPGNIRPALLLLAGWAVSAGIFFLSSGMALPADLILPFVGACLALEAMLGPASQQQNPA